MDQGDVYRIELPKEKNVYVRLIWPQRKQKCFENEYFLKWSIPQEGYIEELSTCFYLDTALLKSSESVLSET